MRLETMHTMQDLKDWCSHHGFHLNVKKRRIDFPNYKCKVMIISHSFFGVGRSSKQKKAEVLACRDLLEKLTSKKEFQFLNDKSVQKTNITNKRVKQHLLALCSQAGLKLEFDKRKLAHPKRECIIEVESFDFYGIGIGSKNIEDLAAQDFCNRLRTYLSMGNPEHKGAKLEPHTPCSQESSFDTSDEEYRKFFKEKEGNPEHKGAKLEPHTPCPQESSFDTSDDEEYRKFSNEKEHNYLHNAVLTEASTSSQGESEDHRDMKIDLVELAHPSRFDASWLGIPGMVLPQKSQSCFDEVEQEILENERSATSSKATFFLSRWCKMNDLDLNYRFLALKDTVSTVFLCILTLESPAFGKLFLTEATGTTKKASKNLASVKAIKYLKKGNLITSDEAKGVDLDVSHYDPDVLDNLLLVLQQVKIYNNKSNSVVGSIKDPETSGNPEHKGAKLEPRTPCPQEASFDTSDDEEYIKFSITNAEPILVPGGSHEDDRNENSLSEQSLSHEAPEQSSSGHLSKESSEISGSDSDEQNGPSGADINASSKCFVPQSFAELKQAIENNRGKLDLKKWRDKIFLIEWCRVNYITPSFFYHHIKNINGHVCTLTLKSLAIGEFFSTEAFGNTKKQARSLASKKAVIYLLKETLLLPDEIKELNLVANKKDEKNMKKIIDFLSTSYQHKALSSSELAVRSMLEKSIISFPFQAEILVKLRTYLHHPSLQIARPACFEESSRISAVCEVNVAELDIKTAGMSIDSPIYAGLATCGEASLATKDSKSELEAWCSKNGLKMVILHQDLDSDLHSSTVTTNSVEFSGHGIGPDQSTSLRPACQDFLNNTTGINQFQENQKSQELVDASQSKSSEDFTNFDATILDVQVPNGEHEQTTTDEVVELRAATLRSEGSLEVASNDARENVTDICEVQDGLSEPACCTVSPESSQILSPQNSEMFAKFKQAVEKNKGTWNYRKRTKTSESFLNHWSQLNQVLTTFDHHHLTNPPVLICCLKMKSLLIGDFFSTKAPGKSQKKCKKLAVKLAIRFLLAENLVTSDDLKHLTFMGNEKLQLQIWCSKNGLKVIFKTRKIADSSYECKVKVEPYEYVGSGKGVKQRSASNAACLDFICHLTGDDKIEVHDGQSKRKVLQSWCSKKGLLLHFESQKLADKVFQCDVTVESFSFVGTGIKAGRKSAEQLASQEFIKLLGAAGVHLQDDRNENSLSEQSLSHEAPEQSSSGHLSKESSEISGSDSDEQNGPSGADINASSKCFVPQSFAELKQAIGNNRGKLDLKKWRDKIFLIEWCRVNYITPSFFYHHIKNINGHVCTLTLKSLAIGEFFSTEAFGNTKKQARSLASKKAVIYLLKETLLLPDGIKELNLVANKKDEKNMKKIINFLSTSYQHKALSSSELAVRSMLEKSIISFPFQAEIIVKLRTYLHHPSLQIARPACFEESSRISAVCEVNVAELDIKTAGMSIDSPIYAGLATCGEASLATKDSKSELEAWCSKNGLKMVILHQDLDSDLHSSTVTTNSVEFSGHGIGPDQSTSLRPACQDFLNNTTGINQFQENQKSQELVDASQSKSSEDFTNFDATILDVQVPNGEHEQTTTDEVVELRAATLRSEGSLEVASNDARENVTDICEVQDGLSEPACCTVSPESSQILSPQNSEMFAKFKQAVEKNKGTWNYRKRTKTSESFLNHWSQLNQVLTTFDHHHLTNPPVLICCLKMKSLLIGDFFSTKAPGKSQKKCKKLAVKLAIRFLLAENLVTSDDLKHLHLSLTNKEEEILKNIQHYTTSHNYQLSSNSGPKPMSDGSVYSSKQKTFMGNEKLQLQIWCSKNGLKVIFKTRKIADSSYECKVKVEPYEYVGSGKGVKQRSASNAACLDFICHLTGDDKIEVHDGQSKRKVLQSWCSKKGLLLHFESQKLADKVFQCDVTVESFSFVGTGIKAGRKSAEQLASQEFIKLLGAAGVHLQDNGALNISEERKLPLTSQGSSEEIPNDQDCNSDVEVLDVQIHSNTASGTSQNIDLSREISQKPLQQAKVDKLNPDWTTIGSAITRLRYFFDENNINAGFIYTTDSDSLEGCCVASMKFCFRRIGRNFSATANASKFAEAAEKCAESIEMQLDRENLLSCYLKRQPLPPIKQPILLNVPDGIVENIRQLCSEFELDAFELLPEEIIEARSILLSPISWNQGSGIRDLSSNDENVHINYEKARINWNTWTIRQINKNQRHYKVSFENMSSNLRTLHGKKSYDHTFLRRQGDRQKLPIFKFRLNILSCVDENSVTIIKGSTGSGKSTQTVALSSSMNSSSADHSTHRSLNLKALQSVCQYILDDAIEQGRGAYCNVIVLEPRRICATSMAERVAYERNEPLGISVGHRVRFDAVYPRAYGSILFCTPGSFLRRAENGLVNISHIIVDEIHERSGEIDYILLIIRIILKKGIPLKVILMSADVDIDLFKSYFDGCGLITLKERCHPVKDYFLEDCIELINFKLKDPHFQSYLDEETEQPFLSKSNIYSGEDLKLESSSYSQNTYKTMAFIDEQSISSELIEAIILWVMEQKIIGSILVFLPGWGNIREVTNYLKKSKCIDYFCILPLHSKVKDLERRQVFLPAPNGKTKIILSSSIAESCITIDDVVCVIDSCRSRISISQDNLSFKYVTEWASKVNLNQRLGRAGRLRPGYCFRLCSKAKYEELPMDIEPQIVRMPLHSIILSIKILKLGNVITVLKSALQPPPLRSIRVAERLLLELNCLDDQKQLTPLGNILGRLPLDPRVGRMLMMSILFGCPNQILKLAAYASTQEEFLDPHTKEIEKIGKERYSDHIAVLHTLSTSERPSHYQNVYRKIPTNISDEVIRIEEQLYSILQRLGFHLTSAHGSGSGNIDLITALLCQAFYPNICATIKKRRVFIPDGKLGLISGNSLIDYNNKDFNPPSRIFVFGEQTEAQVNICRNLTMISPMHLMCFTNCEVFSKKGEVIIDDWLPLKMDVNAASAVMTVRTMISKALLDIGSNPSNVNKTKYSRLTMFVSQLCKTDFDQVVDAPMNL